MQNLTPRLLSVRDAARILGISYSTLKCWIFQKRIKSVKTLGGHHRVPENALDEHLHIRLDRAAYAQRRAYFRSTSARGHLVGRIVDVQLDDMMARVCLSIGDQCVIALTTAAYVRQAKLRVGQRALALIKPTDVMIMRV